MLPPDIRQKRIGHVIWFYSLSICNQFESAVIHHICKRVFVLIRQKHFYDKILSLALSGPSFTYLQDAKRNNPISWVISYAINLTSGTHEKLFSKECGLV